MREVRRTLYSFPMEEQVPAGSVHFQRAVLGHLRAGAVPESRAPIKAPPLALNFHPTGSIE
jgi:hypothetical protein